MIIPFRMFLEEATSVGPQYKANILAPAGVQGRL